MLPLSVGLAGTWLHLCARLRSCCGALLLCFCLGRAGKDCWGSHDVIQNVRHHSDQTWTVQLDWTAGHDTDVLPESSFWRMAVQGYLYQLLIDWWAAQCIVCPAWSFNSGVQICAAQCSSEL